MTTIVLRAVKGSPLTTAEMDANLSNLNVYKAEIDGAGVNTDLKSINPERLQFDLTTAHPAAVGRLTWNNTDGTLNLGLKGGNVNLQIGQETVIRIRNSTASPFIDGQVVRITGASGDRPSVILAQANNSSNSNGTIAVMTEGVAVGAEGFATTMGLVRDLDTSGFAEGSELWLSPTTPGAITSTKPVAPNHSVLIGWCVKSHVTTGMIYIHIQNGLQIDELHDVKITSVAALNTLRRDPTNLFWENVPYENPADSAIAMAIALG